MSRQVGQKWTKKVGYPLWMAPYWITQYCRALHSIVEHFTALRRIVQQHFQHHSAFLALLSILSIELDSAFTGSVGMNSIFSLVNAVFSFTIYLGTIQTKTREYAPKCNGELVLSFICFFFSCGTTTVYYSRDHRPTYPE